MGLIIKNGIRYFGDNSVELTQAQYDALSQEEKLNGTTYYITDGQNITTASAVTYDNTASGLTATNVQGAIDEVDEKTNGLSYEDGESGTLATGLWKYRKWADGTLEVWGHQRTKETVTFNQWGGVYSWDADKIAGSSPVGFVSTDFVSGSLFITGLNGIGTLRTDQAGYIFVRGAVAANGDYATIKYKYQRGRWKA